MEEIKIGDKFSRNTGKGKYADCEIVDIVQRISTKTGKLIDVEYWAKGDSYMNGLSFQVSKTTIFMSRLNIK